MSGAEWEFLSACDASCQHCLFEATPGTEAAAACGLFQLTHRAFFERRLDRHPRAAQKVLVETHFRLGCRTIADLPLPVCEFGNL